MGLLFKLAWRTLIARPTLALLAILLLALSTALLYGLIVSVSVISSLRGSLLNDLAIEIELSESNDSTQAEIVNRLRQRKEVLSLVTLDPREVLAEVEAELGESLSDILTENPFPPILRVKLRKPTPESIETFSSEVSEWPGVLQAVYPRDIWRKFDAWIAALRGRAAYIIGVCTLIGWALVGLSLRAILRNRRTAWQLLLLLGIRSRDLELVQLLMEIALGLLAGLIAVGLIHLALFLVEWMFLNTIAPSTWWQFYCIAVAIGLAILAGIWAPRPSQES